MENEFNKKYAYARSKEILDTYIALLEEAMKHIEEIRADSERLLKIIRDEMKQREEQNLDETQNIDDVIDFYIARSKAVNKVLECYGW